MKNTPHKVIIAIIIGLLSVQTFFPSLSNLLLPEIHAIDHTIEPLDETQNMSLLDKATQPIQTKEYDNHKRFFQFPVSVIEGVVDQPIDVFVVSSQPLDEITLVVAKEAAIVEEEFAAEVKSKKLSEEEQEWTLTFDEELMEFEIPIVFNKIGDYKLVIGEAELTIEVQTEDVAEDDSDDDTDNERIETEVSPSDTPQEGERTTQPSNDANPNENQEDTEADQAEAIAQLTEPVTPLDEISHRDVSNWQEFMAAIVNKDVNYINIVNDFESSDNPTQGVSGVAAGSATSNPTNGLAYIWTNASGISRTLVIEGNGYQIDFRAVAVGFYDSTVNSATPWDITYQNIDVVHGNWYGFMNFTNMSIPQQNLSRMRYHNLTNAGNQLIHSLATPVVMSGEVISHQTPTYTSRSGRVQTINATNQANMEVTQLEILDNATVDMSTINSGNIYLYYATGRMTIGNDVKLFLRAAGTAGEAFGANIYIANGRIEIGNRSELNLTARANSPAISMYATGAHFEMSEDSKVTIKADGRTTSLNGWAYNIIYMGAGSTMLIGNKSSVEIDAVNQGTTTSGVIHVAGAATFIVAKEGILDIKSDGTNPSHSLMTFLSSASTFTFADAQRINLEKTRAVTGNAANSSLISISGSGGLLDVDIQADANGDFSLTLAEGDRFTKHNTVTAYAFLNGKFDTDETVVQEIATMNPRDPIAPDIEVNPENKPDIPDHSGFISIDFISQYSFGDVSISADTKQYNALPQRLSSADGSVTEERPNYVQISDRRAQFTGWELNATLSAAGFRNDRGEELRGARIILENAVMLTNAANSAIPPTYSESMILDPGVPALIAEADANEGSGTWIQRYGDMGTMGDSVKLEVPIGSNPRNMTYQATIEWELSFVPSTE
ncbi:MAG: WxL domain-containing protein [Enterococcus casseliflavus]|nr:WxL domain-containing protein [Enterococcus casseliflavus]